MSLQTFLNGRVTLHRGDCLDVLARLPADGIDAVVTDPPYHLNFMGKAWDGGEIAFEPATWAAMLRVLKPGGHLLAFGAPKNFGFMQYAIAQAGFEVRDVLAWLFGSGFPKSHNIGNGFGTALKPAYEPIIMARKPFTGTVAANVLQHGTGAINVDGCRVATDGETFSVPLADPHKRGQGAGEYCISTRDTEAMHAAQRASIERTATLGRWPANVLHDGSDEVVGAFPESESTSNAKPAEAYRPNQKNQVYGAGMGGGYHAGFADTGSAARFFYTAKADSDDRLGWKHPTVKPLDLMQWLVRLVTPRGGLVLDPFAGTGTTGEAAWREGMDAVLIEREPDYCADIARRMALALSGPDERLHQSMKEKLKGKAPNHGPLFAEIWDKPFA